ncbi:MAG TPA: hypothetical protein VHM70_06110 [Polyangiaceae bacterium]|jgi:hypothetical protein|nr:hypothetical protein [Polyangiaceae bacterium]
MDVGVHATRSTLQSDPENRVYGRRDWSGRNAHVSGSALALLVTLGIFLGSNSLTHFDAALSGYALATVVASYAVGYRFALWAARPPSRLYFSRGLKLLFQSGSQSVGAVAGIGSGALAEVKSSEAAVRLPHGVGTLASELARNFVGQNFIRRRSSYRWIMHLCLSGGCALAFAVTFPLVFGWLHFETTADNAELYQVMLFGMAVQTMRSDGVAAFLAFNALNIAGVLVLIGLVLAGYRRLTDAGERAIQTFSEDIVPLILIAVVTVTGLALTVSYKFLGGRGHGTWAIVHMVAVVALLIHIPFGKLFHMLQRSCALFVSRYKAVGAVGPRAHCQCCGEDYASQMHVDDLKLVLEQLGFDYRLGHGTDALHYQHICPSCRRRRLVFNQGRRLGR